MDLRQHAEDCCTVGIEPQLLQPLVQFRVLDIVLPHVGVYAPHELYRIEIYIKIVMESGGPRKKKERMMNELQDFECMDVRENYHSNTSSTKTNLGKKKLRIEDY